MLLRQSEVKKIVIAEWPAWRDEHGGVDTHPQRSMFWLEMEDRVQFRTRRGGDPWQYVQAWLNEEFGLPRGPRRPSN